MAKRKRQHPDVDFVVGDQYYKNMATASVAIVNALTSRGESQLDVVVHSEKGARWLEGADGVERYREDPDASVYARWTFTADDLGRVR